MEARVQHEDVSTDKWDRGRKYTRPLGRDETSRVSVVFFVVLLFTFTFSFSFSLTDLSVSADQLGVALHLKLLYRLRPEQQCIARESMLHVLVLTSA